jgi:hypothetical protein
MRFFPALLFLFLSHSIFAQVEILAEQDQDRNLTLFGMNKGVIPYTIRIEFSKLQNLESPEGNILFKVATPGKSTLLKLKSIYVNEPTSFNYKTQLYKGDFQHLGVDAPPYLIPLKAGTSLSMRPLTAQNQATGSVYVGVGFFFEQATEICAPRKGIVTEVKLNQKPAAGPADLNTENSIELYHADGTFTRLTGLKANSAKVSPGETVFPGQILAESSPLTDSPQHHVKMIQSRWEMTEKGMIWVNFPVPLATATQILSSNQPKSDLSATHPAELITKEMDKKELKTYQSKK